MTNDKSLFKNSMQHIRPLKPSNKYVHTPKKPAVKIRQSVVDEELALDFSYPKEPDVFGATPLFFAKPGIHIRTIQRIKRGQLAIDATIDLHGYTVNEARRELLVFIETAIRLGHKSLLVIHGKGSLSPGTAPKLKNLVNQVLRHHPHVLLFTSARPKDGGLGAVYTLLKTRNYSPLFKGAPTSTASSREN